MDVSSEPALSNLEYEPYVVMLCEHDAEWSRKSYLKCKNWYEPIMAPARSFRKDCFEYANSIQKNFFEFCQANGQDESKFSKEWSRIYYNPICYFQLGHADIFSIVLLDDFDPIHYLTARMLTTLENVSIGFVPRLSTLGARHEENLFCGLSDFFLKANADDSSRAQPLLVFSKLKMDGLASVGSALLFQSAIWQSIVKRSRKVVKALRRQFPGKELNHPNAPVQPGDVDSLQIAFVDLQGCEEIGLLIFTHNLTVAFSVVSSISSLTYGDVFENDLRLATCVNHSKVHLDVVRQTCPDLLNEKPASILKNNHIFRWVHSSAAVLPSQANGSSSKNFLSDRSSIHGTAHGTTRFQLAPGHASCTEILSYPFRDKAAELTEPLAESKSPEFVQYLVGSYEHKMRHESYGLVPVSGFIPTGDIVQNLEDLLKRLTLDINKGHGRDVIHFETELVVPIPKLSDDKGRMLIFEELNNGHFSPLRNVLSAMIENECYGTGDVPGRLDIPLLMDKQTQLGIPVSLRRTIEYLYQNFKLVTADPNTFDIMLDLYDTFRTLHGVLTKHLPNLPRSQQSRFTGTDLEGRRHLDEEKVQNLVQIAEALHNSVSHRLTNAFGDSANRDMAVDFRGGLNQILYAADAPVKCAVGLLRYCLDDARIRPRDTVGCVIKIGMMPGARCYKARLGIENEARLGFFDVDVPHVLHVASYADYLHEAFHLIFDDVYDSDQVFSKKLNSLESYNVDRLEEIFALMMWKVLVFGEDSTSFLYHSVLSFSRDTSSIGGNDRETCRRFIEVLLRLFCAIDCTKEFKGDPSCWPQTLQYDAENASKRYIKMVRDVGPFYSEYDRLWGSSMESAIWQYTHAHFQKTYAKIHPHLPIIWEKVIVICQRAYERSFPKHPKGIEPIIDIGLNTGKPLLWSSYQTPLDQDRWNISQQNLQMQGIDLLPFVCKILYCYIRTIKKAHGKCIHLPRGSRKAELSYKGSTNWWEFQADKGAAALFSCDPSARKSRLQRQIVTIKSFWNVSSELRARRFMDILSQGSSEAVPGNPAGR